MSNHNSNRMTGVQNMDEEHIHKLDVILAHLLEKEKVKKFTAKSLRRSASVQLAEVGTSIAGLCVAGNWLSTETFRKCAEHVTISTGNCMSILDGNKTIG